MRRISSAALAIFTFSWTGLAFATDPAFIRDEEKAAKNHLTPANIAKAMSAPRSSIQATTAAAVHGMGERVVIIDVRPRSDFARLRIPNAKHLPDPATLAGLLPTDKSATIVVYGVDANDANAEAIVKRISSEGYASVLWMRGGFAEWVSAQLPTAAS